MQCEYCSSKLDAAQKRWCSKRCNDLFRAKVPTRPLECPGCMRTVLVPAGRHPGRKYCTRSCATATYNRLHLRGARNGRWRGGRVLNYGPGWKSTKVKVRERDRDCRNCGKSPAENGRALDVHHIQPFRFSGDHSLDNLVALCRSCHMRADDHGRRGSALFLAEAGYRPTITKRELRRHAAAERAAQRAVERREARAHALELAELGLSPSHRESGRRVPSDHRELAPSPPRPPGILTSRPPR